MFRKLKSKQQENPVADKIANWISTAIGRLKTKFAVFMSKRTEGLSAIALKMILLVFCVSWFAVCVYFIAGALAGGSPQKKLNIPHFKLTEYAVREAEEKAGFQEIIAKRDYHMILQFRKYMDSLRLYAGRSYDSIMIARPRLIDSVNKLEQIYNQQKK